MIKRNSKTTGLQLIFTFLFLFMANASFAQNQMEQVVSNLNKGKYGKIQRCFAGQLAESISKKQLKQLWEQSAKTYGDFKELSNLQVEQVEDNTQYKGLVRFEKASFNMGMMMNKDEKIIGLIMSPLSYQEPKYGKGLIFGKKYLTVKTDTFEMPGELIIPMAGSECPVVVFVHGSGPNDKDETIGPNKVFYDLAVGLAAKGIATFRYDKRTKVYPHLLEGQFDINEETIDDAKSALEMIKADTTLKFTKYIVLGHSLGAYCVPIICDDLPWVDGGVVFSGNTRRFEDLIEYQYDYLLNLDGKLTKEEAQEIERIGENAEKIRNQEYSNTTPAKDLLAYWPGKFWKSIDAYKPTQVVSNNDKTEFFILQGEKDYQITMVDYSIWREEVGTKDNVKMMSFPNLTHLFTPTESKKPGPSDYFMPHNVDEQVILEIADWIKLVVPEHSE